MQLYNSFLPLNEEKNIKIQGSNIFENYYIKKYPRSSILFYLHHSNGMVAHLILYSDLILGVTDPNARLMLIVSLRGFLWMSTEHATSTVGHGRGENIRWGGTCADCLIRGGRWHGGTSSMLADRS